MDRCQWKLVEPMSFTFGVKADRCGEVADVKIVRPQRKKDLFLCEEHVNAFINEWGLRQSIEILCRCKDNDWNKARGIDWDDIPPAPLVADPDLVTHRISSGTKLPQEGRTCTCRNGCKAWDCDGGRE